MPYTRADVLLIAEIAASLASDLTNDEDDRAQAFPGLADGYGWDTMLTVCAELADHIVGIIHQQYDTCEAFYTDYMEGPTFNGPGVFVYDVAPPLIAALKAAPYDPYSTHDYRTMAVQAFEGLKITPAGQNLAHEVTAILFHP